MQISIHALRKESDMMRVRSDLIMTISIHALRKESDDSNYFQMMLL